MASREKLMEIRVALKEAFSVQGEKEQVVMIPFSGEASGPYFSGRIIGPGVDTQRIGADKKARLSARYMLEGADRDGNACRVFVENEGGWETGFSPSIVTDSPLLRRFESAILTATVEGCPGGVLVSIYTNEQQEE